MEREIVKSSNVIGDSSATHDKPRRETCEKPSRSSISGNKDWEDRRRRDDDKPKHRDKPRDRRDSEKFKRDRDEIGKTTGRSNYNRNNTENSSGYKDDSHSRSSQSSRSSDWHHDKSERCPMKSHVSSSHAVSTGAKTGDRGTRGGKSYEKSRESIAKARNESKTSIVPKSSEHLEAQSSGLSKEDKKNAEFQVDSSLPVGGFEKESSTSVDREDSDCVKAVDDKYVSEDYEKFVDDADENIQEGKRHKENGNSRDPRSERRIRNKASVKFDSSSTDTVIY